MNTPARLVALFILMGPLVALPTRAWAGPERSKDAPLLCWDLDASLGSGFRNFRTSDDTPKPAADGFHPDTTGLGALHESGSSAFSTAGLKTMLSRMTGPVTVFDLRQEDHALLNGLPVSLYASNNWANVGKGPSEIAAEEVKLVDGFKKGAFVSVSTDKAKKGEGNEDAAKVEVTGSGTEEAVVRANGASYVRIPVSDHCRPSDEAVDEFVNQVRRLPSDAWVHFHCRAGKGRTTTFMALYDMLRNAQRVSLLDIDRRQSGLVGDYDLLGKEGETGPKQALATERADFVRKFYDYAKANPGGRPLLWSEWLRLHP